MKMKIVYGILHMVVSIASVGAVEIAEIQESHLVDARTIIYNAVFELQIIPSATIDEAIHFIKETDSLSDLASIDALEQTYTLNKGCFFVALVNGAVIGIGALKKIDDQTCELKRMFFSPEYRGKGFGSQLLKRLLLHATALNYKKVQLSVWNPLTQSEAINFYKKFGFSEIDLSTACSGKVFMEKKLH